MPRTQLILEVEESGLTETVHAYKISQASVVQMRYQL